MRVGEYGLLMVKLQGRFQRYIIVEACLLTMKVFRTTKVSVG